MEVRGMRTAIRLLDRGSISRRTRGSSVGFFRELADYPYNLRF